MRCAGLTSWPSSSTWVCDSRISASHLAQSLESPCGLDSSLFRAVFSEYQSERSPRWWSLGLWVNWMECLRSRLTTLLQSQLRSFSWKSFEEIRLRLTVRVILYIFVLEDWKKFAAVNFSEFDREPSGKVNLIGRVKWVVRSVICSGDASCPTGVILMLRNVTTLNFSSDTSQMDCPSKSVHTEIEKLGKDRCRWLCTFTLRWPLNVNVAWITSKLRSWNWWSGNS